MLVGIADYEGAIEDAIQTACVMVAEARQSLSLLGDSESRDALIDIISFVDKLLKKCR